MVPAASKVKSTGSRPLVPRSATFVQEWSGILLGRTIAPYSFDDFCARILNENSNHPDARLLGIKRHQEGGRGGHEFITVQVESHPQTYWLRIERRVRPTIFLTLDGSFRYIEGYDTVKLAQLEHHLLNLSPRLSRVKSTVTYTGEDGSKPSLKDLARLLAIIRETSPSYWIFGRNCFFVVSILEEVLADERLHERSLEGKISVWASWFCPRARSTILERYHTPSPPRA